MWSLCRFLDSGGVYKLAFGPKAFIVVSDPVVVRHLLKVNLIYSRDAAPPLVLYMQCEVSLMRSALWPLRNSQVWSCMREAAGHIVSTLAGQCFQL